MHNYAAEEAGAWQTGFFAKAQRKQTTIHNNFYATQRK
jgi:hypothetical protein